MSARRKNSRMGFSAATATSKQQPPISRGGHAESPCSELDVEAFQRLLSGYEKARNEGFAPVNPVFEELLSANRTKKLFEDQGIWVPGLTDSQDDAHSQEITPDPFYFVKSCDMEGQKVFINMCGCSEIAAPGEWQNGVPRELEESFSILESNADYGTQNLRFSLSCADYMLWTDKWGKLCKVYDVVFNLVVMRHSMMHKQLRTFLINMAITWIRQKYGVELKSDYKLPRGKYKGDFIRKHHIRAPKAGLVTEISDAEADLQPTFPLLSIKPAQILDLQAVELEDSEKFDNSSAISEPSPCMHELHKTIPPHSLLEDKTETQETPEGLSHSFQEGPNEYKRTQDDDRGGCEINPNANFASGEMLLETHSNASGEQVFHVSSLAIFSGGKNGPLEIEDTVASHDTGTRPMQLSFKQTPLIQTKFLGCPVELVILCITFPTSVEVQELQVWTSRKELYVEAGSFDPITLSLMLPTNPTESRASFSHSEGLLEVYLPFLPYAKLLE